MKIPDPVLVGFFPKRTVKRPDCLKNDGVEVICSVSDHISKGPDNWMRKLKHNELGFYDSEDIALSIIGSDVNKFDMYAYRLFPLEFDEGRVNNFRIPVCLSADRTNFQLLGYDVANRSVRSPFECSALSCNAGAENFTVNRYCLFGDITVAYDAAKIISQGNYEPGPWYLLEVYRKYSEP